MRLVSTVTSERKPFAATARTQVDDLVGEVRAVAAKGFRSLVTVLTKRMAEDLTEYLHEQGIRVRYMHSDIDTIERIEIIRDLRLGAFDALVGINLLREGLDIPECALVAILDADKEGFLRSETSLIQTIGRAARNVSGQVHMYADTITASMAKAIDETTRRRAKQVAYNLEKGVDPQPLRKRIADILDDMVREGAEEKFGSGRTQSRGKAPVPGMSSKSATIGKHARELAGMPRAELALLIQQLADQMHEAARDLQFELAARLRDEINELKKELRGMDAAGIR